MTWAFQPHSGGVKLSERQKRETRQRIEHLAKEIYKDRCIRVKVRFRTQLCYLDAIVSNEAGESTQPLCRLRHFDAERWSISLYTWSSEKYEPTIFPSGHWFGTLRECVDLGGAFLD